ncbi:hypothetical protein K501DRAFT_332230 [Backusella circina FSU 941]|nr:hypothetical protein K501DRAFT_332230 [Backusella circina FSU 941]
MDKVGGILGNRTSFIPASLELKLKRYTKYEISWRFKLLKACIPSTARILSVSPSSPLTAFPDTSRELFSNPINSLLYADDVAVIGSPHQVQRMMDLAVQHSHRLEYRWSPSKCVVLNAPLDRTIILYSEPIPAVDSFTYLGVPFHSNGISAPDMLAHRQKGTLAGMVQLNSIGERFINRTSSGLVSTNRVGPVSA